MFNLSFLTVSFPERGVGRYRDGDGRAGGMSTRLDLHVRVERVSRVRSASTYVLDKFFGVEEK